MSKETSRRFFLGAATALAAQRVMGANERPSLVVIGIGGRGRDHLNNYGALKSEVDLIGVCDVNQAARERGAAMVLKSNQVKAREYDDMRKVFEDKDVNAVSFATPNHWHALGTIWALRAGKDVYVEKPASHNIYEGTRMVEEARKLGRMVQVGSQSRSIPHKMEAMQRLQEGVIGKIYQAKALCYKRRKSIGRTPELDQPPSGIDWDQFLGPAPMRKFTQNRFAYNWHWFWDTGNGDIGNQGVHEMDIARWGMGVSWPTSVVSTGGKLVYDDDQETPNTQLTTLDYGNGQSIVFEVRGMPSGPDWPLKKRGANTVGNIFFGSDGILAVDGSGYQVYKGEELALSVEVPSQRGSDVQAHMSNFLKGVKSRNYKDLNAEIEIGAISAGLCHLANIAYRVGRKLEFDPAALRFPNAPDANLHLTRDYRKPYVV
ncbi:MAG: Gfo/Idh/MocA family oxidoreductase [Bryobacter sp.]|nr:Gfo/Idh/MocA family oxidoreductase [Bryobacter sp.]